MTVDKILLERQERISEGLLGVGTWLDSNSTQPAPCAEKKNAINVLRTHNQTRNSKEVLNEHHSKPCPSENGLAVKWHDFVDDSRY